MRPAPPSAVVAGVAVALMALAAPALRADSLDFPYKVLSSWHESQKVFALARTPDGFLWAGTDSGLLRYDGLSFERFTVSNTPGLRGNIVTALAVDRTGALWIGLADGQGLARKVGAVISAVASEGALPDVDTLAVDGEDHVFAGTVAGLFVVDAAGPTMRARRVRAFAAQPIYALHARRAGGVWVGDQRGLHACDGEQAAPVGSHGAVSAITELADGRVVVADAVRGLVERRGAEQRVLLDKPPPGRDAGLFTAVAVDRAGALFIGWGAGFARFADGALDSVQDIGRSVVDFLIDPEDNVWVATYWGLVLRLGRPQIHNTRFSQPEDMPVVFSVVEDERGDIYATHRMSMVRLRGNELVRWRSGEELRSWCVRPMAPARGGGIWLGSCDLGLHLVKDDQIMHIGERHPVPARSIQFLHADAEGRVWIGSELGPLYRYDEAGLHEIAIPNGSCPKQRLEKRPGVLAECDFSVTAIVRDGQDRLWATVRRNGLRRIDPDGTITSFGRNEGLPTPNLIALHASSDGVLWIGTQGHGLVRREGQRFAAVDRSRGLPLQSVHGITETHDGRHLWLSGEEGVVRIERQVLDDFFAGRRERIEASLFGVPDGLEEFIAVQSFSAPLWLRRDGVLMVATDKGLLRLDTPRIDSTKGFAPPLIEGVRVNGVRLDGGAIGHFDLPFGSRGLDVAQFDVAVPNFTAPRRIQVRYRLHGFDGDWRDAGLQRQIKYTGLPPGRYVFEAVASKDGVSWAPAVKTAALSVRGFYQRPLFFGLLALALLPLLGVAHIVRLSFRQAGLRRVIEERNRIARDLHDSLAQYFTGISFQVERLRLVAEKEPAALDEIAEETQVMVTRGRLEARQAIHDLRSRREGELPLSVALRELVGQSRPELPDREVRIEVEVRGRERRLDPEVQGQLLRIAQEATVNALVHGQASHVEIGVNFDRRGLALHIRDNGVGVANGDIEDRALHHGVLGMKERAALLDGAFEITATKGGGTLVQVRVGRAGLARRSPSGTTL